MTISRRHFLRSLGVASAAVPCLPLLSSAQDSPEFPRRVLIFFTANGTIHENWAPSGTENDFQLSRILAPLEAYKDKLLIVDELEMTSAKHGPGDDHQKGMGHVLTGTELLEGNEFPGCGGDCPGSGWGGGISVDQAIANEIGNQTRFPSLEIGVQVRSNTVWSRMCYSGANQPIPAEDSPWSLANRVFGDLGSDPFNQELQREAREKRAIIDLLQAEYAALDGKVSNEDRIKLQAHLEALDEIERRLDLTDDNALGQFCEIPDPGSEIDVYANDNFPALGRLQMDLAAMAFACDQTRVITLQWSRAVSNTQFSWLDIPEGHHDLSHEGDENTDAVEKLTVINEWYAEQYAYLLGKLASIPEGNGTLLDNTAVVWVNELGRGNRHSHSPQPVVIAGSGGGYFRTGRYIKTGGASHNDVLTSLCHQMGLTHVDRFGNPQYGSGPLANAT